MQDLSKIDPNRNKNNDNVTSIPKGHTSVCGDLMLPENKELITDTSPLSALMQVKQKHETEVDILITDE